MKLIEVQLHENGDYWLARWYAPDGSRKSRSLGPKRKMSRRAAEEECRRLEWEMNSGRMAPGECPTLAQWVEHHRKVRNVKPSTAAQQDTTIDKYLLPRFGERRMDEVGLADVQTWLAWLRKRPGIESEWTVSGHLRVAEALWNAAVRAYGGQSPFGMLSRDERPRTTSRTPVVPKWLTEADLLRICEAANPDWKAAVALCGLAGLRVGEARVITWDRVVWNRNRLVVPQPKIEGSTGREDRECRLEPALARVLLECREVARPKEPRITRAWLANSNRQMPVIVRRAGMVPWPDPLKALRRWRASTWREHFPEHVVNKWLGHSQKVAEDHYLTVADAHYGEQSEVEQLRAKVAELEAKVKQEVVNEP